jgi:hypothetical protein
MIVDKITEYLNNKEINFNQALADEVGKMASLAFKRQFMEEEQPAVKGRLRLSACGRCPRQNAYGFFGVPKRGKQIDARAKQNFFFGDLTESAIVSLMKLSGISVGWTGSDQDEIRLEINGAVVTGHPDGFFWHQGKLYLLEVKSMTHFAFSDFEKGVIDSGYLAQIESYLSQRQSAVACCMVALNKDSGVISEKLIERDAERLKQLQENLKEVIHSTPEKLPPPPSEYEPDPKTGFYDWHCLYCSWRDECRTDGELILVKNAYKLKRRKENAGNV